VTGSGINNPGNLAIEAQTPGLRRSHGYGLATANRIGSP
jgi:hypothetical protein